MDDLTHRLRGALPDDVVVLVEEPLRRLEEGDFQAVLTSDEAQHLFGHIDSSTSYDGHSLWTDWIFERLGSLLSDRSRTHLQAVYFTIGYTALLAFIQASVTGPPLSFNSSTTLLPKTITTDAQKLQTVRQALLSSRTSDGIAAYKLTPNVELLCLAEAIFTSPAIFKNIEVARWARMRAVFTQQRLLSEASSTLQALIYDDLTIIEQDLALQTADKVTANVRSQFLLERAAIHLHHGLDKLAREDIEQATAVRHFQYRLTGRLGKRTKFQQHDISQLVVLARSADSVTSKMPVKNAKAQPESIDLNDDTLLERIAFTEDTANHQDPEVLPPALADLDPSSQPQLDPIDSTILLSFASSITNTSPENGLTREELLPYANRVLDGGSSNWQIYTQALLVRSRVEGYKSRTVERGLLQLQALVDQVIAETTSIAGAEGARSHDAPSSTFLPRPKQSESAPVDERLRYIFQLASPSRWDLEAELASRWVALGGLRSALEIYERLQMWAEAALCWAATENEDKARRIVRSQLFHRAEDSTQSEEDETWEGPVRDPAPLDAPRLYCILGDMDQSVEMYEKAWAISGQRYARAQRAIGRLFFAKREYALAADAYAKSLKVNQLNHQSWFALGCALIELEQYNKAVEAFSRCVQLDDADAEAWSNLAAALLRADPADEPAKHTLAALDEEVSVQDLAVKPVVAPSQRNRINALKAFQRAASIKSDSYRIWQNVLVTAASLSPPDFASIYSAQKKVIGLRGKTDGEKCVDEDILEHLVQYVIESAETYDASKPGIARMTVKLVDEDVVPLITASAQLWRLVSRLALWRQRPATALEAEEKAWRAITSQPGWETQTEGRWNDVVEATIRLCDSYESLGPRERTEGLSAGSLVASDWKFKARSAIRGIMNRGKDSWQDTAGWDRLQEAQQSLKG
ncbi:hypothetical protein AMS68_005916 [Peltaster fructicola]|uniref:Uncharacterized protein n=1 Tax=Peltaster fructicola TaxID=286661 RepID=A0A6H0Y0K2_9PEZI|nr:hypothetical protein AMS68_005916 [Peltaster fructicola]